MSAFLPSNAKLVKQTVLDFVAAVDAIGLGGRQIEMYCCGRNRNC